MDTSITQKHSRCLWKYIQFLGQELVCPEFTNAKAFVLSFDVFVLADYILSTDRFLFIPRPVFLMTLALSGITTVLECYGLGVRLSEIYDVYWPSCPCIHIPEDLLELKRKE